jgi:metallophosphoesterase (TIGR00282 family)
MRVLFVGDIVGKPGRTILKQQVPLLVRQHAIDFVVANGENAASGAGITKSIAAEILASGVNGITLGDHVWDQKDFVNEIGQIESLCRPANLPRICPGKPYLILESQGKRLAVITVLGQVFMKIQAQSPLETLESLLPELKKHADAILVEVHAETTSEKVALGYFLDGKVAAVIGTHTHIPTADAKILPRGTGYLTDAGMTGPYHSVLGREIQPVIDRMRDGMPRRFPVASGEVKLCGCIMEFNEQGTCTSILPVQIEEQQSPA